MSKKKKNPIILDNKKEYEEHTNVNAETSEEFIKVGGMVTRSLVKKGEEILKNK